MYTHEHSATLFADAIAIAQWLERDRDLPYADRLSRDRAIAADLPAHRVQRVRGWWYRIRADGQSKEQAADAERADHLRDLISIAAIVVGLIAGIALASAAFHYDGTWPVNVVTVVAAIVLLQVVLVIATLLLMAPRLPGLWRLQRLIGNLNPGAIIAAIARRVSRNEDSASRYLDWKRARGPSASRFARWQILTWSQLGAVAFNIAVILTALGLVVFTDLAFGWSTTLRLSSEEAQRLVQVISMPWQWIWPEAVPNASLIEQSRYFRLAASPPPAIEASALTGWWPFLIAAIVTYGLLPRVVLLTFAFTRLRAATVNLLMSDANVTALLDRMQASEVSLGATAPEFPDDASLRPLAPTAPSAKPRAIALVWSAALASAEVRGWAAAHLQWQIDHVFEAGGSIAADQALLSELSGLSPAAVLIFVRGWEAPLLDLEDFLLSLRSSVGTSCSIVVVPVGASGETITDTQRTTWARWTARIPDSAMYVAEGV